MHRILLQCADLDVLGSHFWMESCRSVRIWRCWELTFRQNPAAVCGTGGVGKLLLDGILPQCADLEVLGSNFWTESCRSVRIWMCWEVTFGRNPTAVCGYGGVAKSLLDGILPQCADLEVLGSHFWTESCRSVWIQRCWEVTFEQNPAAVCGSRGVG